MLVPWRSLNGTHRRTAQYKRGADRKRRRLAVEEEREVTTRAFSAYGPLLEMVTFFIYLGQVISAADDNWTLVFWNFSQEKALWKRMTRVLSREGAEPQVSGFFFKAVVQAVLPFVVTPCTGRELRGFQGQVARRIMGHLPRRKPERKWTYTLAATAREDAGFQTIEEYIRRRQNMVVQYIATRSLLDLCEGSERAPGERAGMRWWDQAGINLEGEREASAAVAEKDGGEE